MVLLARALAQDTPIILLDEATSQIDQKNDLLIQNLIKKYFFKNCTILTIAHRLNTLKDYDVT